MLFDDALAAERKTYVKPSQRRMHLVETILLLRERGDWREAIALANICCRERVVAPEDILLRADLLARQGQAELAHADLLWAYEIDPTIAALQMRLLASFRTRGEDDKLQRLCDAILRQSTALAPLQAAFALSDKARDLPGLALLRVSREAIRAVLLSREPAEVEVDFRFQNATHRVLTRTVANPSPASVLAATGTVELPWPDQMRTVRAASRPGLLWPQAQAFRPYFVRRPKGEKPPPRPRGQRGADMLTVIVPVYDGREATLACLDSLAGEGSERPMRIVLVDDCGPDPALRADIRRIAEERGYVLVVNPFNLGFIGSVNRAFAMFPDGDAILLNADTLVPPGAFARLAQAARSRPFVGTVTPLSNNGELTSTPVPFGSSPMPALDEVVRIDAAAQAANRERRELLPNGVGFCFYITASCRRAVGMLNDVDFLEGYLEEVDFCLRAEEAGFVHLCACDVFVGHAGGQSFQDRRRSLVVRNLAKLQRQFPTIRTRTFHFVEADPLAPARHALQRELLATGAFAGGEAELVIGARAMPDQDGADLPRLAGSPGRWLRLVPDPLDPFRLVLQGPAGPAPERLPITLAAGDPAAALLPLLAPFQVSRILYLGLPARDWLAALPARLGVAHEIRLVDAELGAADADIVAALVASAAMVSSASPGLAAEASRRFGREVVADRRAAPSLVQDSPHDGLSAPPAVAVVLDKTDRAAAIWLRDLARAALAARAPVSFVVFGASAADDELRATGAITVIERPGPETAALWATFHGCRATLALLPHATAEHPCLPLLARLPQPLLTTSPYLADALGRPAAALPPGRLDDAAPVLARLAEALSRTREAA